MSPNTFTAGIPRTYSTASAFIRSCESSHAFIISLPDRLKKTDTWKAYDSMIGTALARGQPPVQREHDREHDDRHDQRPDQVGDLVGDEALDLPLRSAPGSS